MNQKELIRTLLSAIIDKIDETQDDKLESQLLDLNAGQICPSPSIGKLTQLAVDSHDAAKLCGVGIAMIPKWEAEGLLTPVRTGGRKLYLVDDLRACLEKQKERPKQAPRGSAVRAG